MLSQKGRNLPKSPIRKLIPYADEAKKRGITVHHLNIGQPDVKTPEVIFDRIRNFEQEVLSYGPSQGIPQLREAIADYLNEDYSLDVEPDDVFITTGGSEAVLFLMLAILDPGDEILIPEPFYANYNSLSAVAGVKVVPVTTQVEDGFHLPGRDAIESKITDRTKAMMICTPNNPTGTVLEEEEMKMLVDISVDNDLWLLADEVYREFVFDGRKPASFLQFGGKAREKIVIADSISKRFSCCGARIGFIITRNQELYDAIMRFGMARLCPPTIEQYGATAGFKNRHSFIDDMIGEYEYRRDVVYEEIQEIDGMFTLKPEGAFYTVVKLPVSDSEDFVRWMLTDFNLNGKTTMIAPASGFYATPGKGKDEARIAYVLEEDNLREAMRILKSGLDAYKG